MVIFAAGYRHHAELNIFGGEELPSRIGIHGPGHFDPGSGSYDSSLANAQVQRITIELKSYFSGLGVSERIVDDMIAVPFNDIKLLSRSELKDYGIVVR